MGDIEDIIDLTHQHNARRNRTRRERAREENGDPDDFFDLHIEGRQRMHFYRDVAQLSRDEAAFEYLNAMNEKLTLGMTIRSRAVLLEAGTQLLRIPTPLGARAPIDEQEEWLAIANFCEEQGWPSLEQWCREEAHEQTFPDVINL